jgi:hypothetical protein
VGGPQTRRVGGARGCPSARLSAQPSRVNTKE